MYQESFLGDAFQYIQETEQCTVYTYHPSLWINPTLQNNWGSPWKPQLSSCNCIGGYNSYVALHFCKVDKILFSIQQSILYFWYKLYFTYIESGIRHARVL